MRSLRRFTAPSAALSVAAVTLVCLAALPVADAARAQDTRLIPAAPPEGAELAYDIPIPAWLAPTVVELKTEYVDGLAYELAWIADNRITDDLATLVEAGAELGASGERVDRAMHAIGELDVTFGIEGISRIIPAQGALRDTLFGFVVWHESASGDSRELMTMFEGYVDRIARGGEAAARLSGELSSLQERVAAASDTHDFHTIAELTPRVVETATNIDAVCRSLADVSNELGALIAEMSIDSPTALVEEWREAAEATASCSGPAAKTSSALESAADVLAVLMELTHIVEGAAESFDGIPSEPHSDGNFYFPWSSLVTDWRMVEELEKHILSGEVPGCPEESKARLTELLPKQVEANGMLAQRAVEYTCLVVARATGVLEDRYRQEHRFSSDLSDRRQRNVLEKVDKSMREDIEFASMKLSTGGAIRALDEGGTKSRRTRGSAWDALYEYNNAWLHCLNAGASASRLTGMRSSR